MTYQDRYYRKNADKIKSKARKWYLKHREEILNKHKEKYIYQKKVYVKLPFISAPANESDQDFYTRTKNNIANGYSSMLLPPADRAKFDSMIEAKILTEYKSKLFK